MLTRDEQSTIFGGAATILGINEMLNAQVTGRHCHRATTTSTTTSTSDLLHHSSLCSSARPQSWRTRR